MTGHSERLRRNLLVGGGTGVLLLLLFLYPTSTNHVDHPATPAAAPGVVSTSAGDVTVNGASAGTRYGPVQVRIAIRANRLVTVEALVYPSSGGRDREISSYALPQLKQEALAAQSSHIDTVSGATFTSDGYRRSLQSALDAAHFRTAG
ncbi:FMN-binding protein [Kribbella sp.]|uniref:FMN-binding protein n=1 Tax=Kribbella sp. TaxID=1871183 RepID=UPI002D5A04A5|nr:FMN-binding protein [Kribbella sp.]HZX06231.1 FMN-binding protein [Kribbella sp.]